MPGLRDPPAAASSHQPTPSIPAPPLQRGAALIEPSSVYRSALPIGFRINGIIFLIKQGGGAGVRECKAARELLEDVMTE